HQNGVLHRDLKPGNVLIDLNDQVHVTDFGLAKQVDADSSVTGSGMALGTPNYMAPEQAGGHSDRATRHSDIYSLGAVLFSAIAGRPPFQSDNTMETLVNVVHKPAPLLSTVCPDVPGDLETIVAKCLEKDPNERYATAARLADDLDRYLNQQPIQARPRSRIVRAWHWLEGVPLVGALTGRRLLETSDGHRQFQSFVLTAALLLPFLLLGAWAAGRVLQERMPKQVLISGGLEGGVYNDVADKIGGRIEKSYGVTVQTLPSGGTLDNQQRLLSGRVHLAPMQASAIDGQQLCVAAPLFYEAVHVLVRQGSGIETVEQLRGREVAVGPRTSGSRIAAEMLFRSYDMPADVVHRREIQWSDLARGHVEDGQPVPEAAVICIGLGCDIMHDLLASDHWTVLPIDRIDLVSQDHPALITMRIIPEDYPEADILAEGVQTVGTTAFLATRTDTPNRLITATMEALYGQPPLITGMISKERAAEYQGWTMHPAARRYYHEE
ncbi:MAG: serine/threonine-protein kinase, partial [Planctomycetota bacterium]